MHFYQPLSDLMTEAALSAPNEKIWILTLAFALCAGWVDCRTRRIPNWLTVPGLLAGIALNAVLGGWHGAKASLEGAGLALGLLLPVVLLRGLGAGDWKLMGAIGALLGWRPMLFLLCVSILISAVMALVQMLVTRRVKQTLWNTLVLAKGLATFGLRMKPGITLDNPTLLKVPFGAAVGLATVAIFALVHWPH